MKAKLTAAIILLTLIFTGLQVSADEQDRKVDPFTDISLRIGATVHLEQGPKQKLEIVAKSSTLDEIITEVKSGKLIIRFPNKNYLWSTFHPGEITIYITVPEITGLGIAGSGDIIAEDEINSKMLELAVSGSGNIKLSELSAERVKSTISGSGNIILASKKTAQDLSVTLSGSGNFKGLDFSAEDVNIRVSGSGNVGIEAQKNLYVRLAGSGNVTYKGRPLIDQAITGSGSVKSTR